MIRIVVALTGNDSSNRQRQSRTFPRPKEAMICIVMIISLIIRVG